MSLDLDNPVVEIGDSQAQFEAWRLQGVDDDNSDRGRLYVSMEASSVLNIYSDRDRTVNVATVAAVSTGVRNTITEVGTSGLTGSVFVKAVTETSLTVVYALLASEQDIIERDDNVRGFFLEEPAEADFSVITNATLRAFLLKIQERFPPSNLGTDPLAAFPGTSFPAEAGNLGRSNIEGALLWARNNEGDFEIVGLDNPGDYREWAILDSLARIWRRKVRSGDDPLLARAEVLQTQADREFERVVPWIDLGADRVPDRPIQTTSLRLKRG